MVKNNISIKKLREFGLIIGFLFPLIIGLILPALGGHQFRFWTVWVGSPFLIFTLIQPNLLLYPYKTWMLIGNFLGWLNSRIILGLVFIIIVQPIALIMRIIGHDPLRMKKFGQKSYREIKTNQKINLKKIF